MAKRELRFWGKIIKCSLFVQGDWELAKDETWEGKVPQKKKSRERVIFGVET